jgi:hypothetical protein
VAGLFGDLRERFFSMDGHMQLTLRTTVQHALKQSKWDSVSTLLTQLLVEDAGTAEQKRAKEKAKATAADEGPVRG